MPALDTEGLLKKASSHIENLSDLIDSDAEFAKDVLKTAKKTQDKLEECLRYGYVVTMRLLQSEVEDLDPEELDALRFFTGAYTDSLIARLSGESMIELPTIKEKKNPDGVEFVLNLVAETYIGRLYDNLISDEQRIVQCLCDIGLCRLKDAHVKKPKKYTE